MVDFDKIEDLIYNFMIKNSHSPKYILMDKKTHDEFNSYFKPKQRIGTPPPTDFTTVTWNSANSTKPIDILCVDTNKTLLEAIGR